MCGGEGVCVYVTKRVLIIRAFKCFCIVAEKRLYSSVSRSADISATSIGRISVKFNKNKFRNSKFG